MNVPVTIVGCSGYAEEIEKKECLKYMDDYIVKPAARSDMERIMNTYFFNFIRYISKIIQFMESQILTLLEVFYNSSV